MINREWETYKARDLYCTDNWGRTYLHVSCSAYYLFNLQFYLPFVFLSFFIALDIRKAITMKSNELLTEGHWIWVIKLYREMVVRDLLHVTLRTPPLLAAPYTSNHLCSFLLMAQKSFTSQRGCIIRAVKNVKYYKLDLQFNRFNMMTLA